MSGTYTIAGNKDFQRGPIMTIEVTSPTESSALASYRLVVDEAASTLDRLQDEVQANPAFRVKMQRLTAPAVASASALVKLRAALIALLIGLFVTLAAVFAVESIEKGKARRAAAAGGEPDARAGVVADLGAATEPPENGLLLRRGFRPVSPRRRRSRWLPWTVASRVSVEDRTEDGPPAGLDQGERTATGEDLAAEQAAARRRERAARRRASAARRRQAEAAPRWECRAAGSASAKNAGRWRRAHGRNERTEAATPEAEGHGDGGHRH